jgi:uncharacterized membrane protein
VNRFLHRQAEHDDAAGRTVTAPLRDPRGGATTVEAAVRRIAFLRTTVDDAVDAGWALHRRIPPGQRRLVRALPVLDWLILLWFFVGVLNVDLTRLDPTAVIAAALAALCTVAVAAWNTGVAQHLQRSKDPRTGDVVWENLGATGWALLAVSTVLAGLLGATMFVRVSEEVVQAGGLTGGAVVVIAATAAASVVTVNLLVIVLAYRDGSATTRELEQLAHAALPHLRREHRSRRRAGRAARRAAVHAAVQERLDTSLRASGTGGGSPEPPKLDRPRTGPE